MGAVSTDGKEVYSRKEWRGNGIVNEALGKIKLTRIGKQI